MMFIFVKIIYLNDIIRFKGRSRARLKEGKEKRSVLESSYTLHKGRELTLSAFKRGIFPLKSKKGKELTILALTHILQRLPITLALVKAVNTSETLLNEILQIIYSLDRAKEVTKQYITI